VAASESYDRLHNSAQEVDCTEKVQDDQMQPEPDDQIPGPEDQMAEGQVAPTDGPIKRRRCESSERSAYRKFMRKAFPTRRRVDVTAKDVERQRLHLAHTLLRGKSVPPKIQHI
jgi:hypothetical protein